jgi:glycosyltransferase involved in cell wall biosynthesis
VSEPLFSIILPAYARPRLLAEALGSVLAQTLQDFECIVVDDASPRPFETQDDPRIRLVRRDTHGGPTAARNTGLNHARGRYVVFLDDDDLFTPERLSLGLDGMARASCSICWSRWIGRNGRTSWSRVLEGDVRDSIFQDAFPHLGQVTMRRDLVPRFDERFTVKEDTEWWIRVVRRYPVTTVPRVGYVWRAHEGPRLTSRLIDRVRGNLLLLQVHADFFATRPRVAAQRWRAVGVGAYYLGDYRLALRASARALRSRPDARTLLLLMRSMRRSGARSARIHRSRAEPNGERSAGSAPKDLGQDGSIRTGSLGMWE